MARDNIDEIPMLLDPLSQGSPDNLFPEVELPYLTIRRSASMSLPTTGGVRRHDKERKVIPFSGPLRSERMGHIFVPMSGPLQSDRGLQGARLPMSSLSRSNRKMREKVADTQGTINVAGSELATNDNYVGKHEHLLKSGPLGRCNDPFCTTCPSYYGYKEIHVNRSQLRPIFNYKGRFFGDAKGSIKNDYNCIILNRTLATVITVLRSMTDFVYFLHMLLQFRLAYVAPESRVVGSGDLVDDPKEIAHHYLSGYFIVDLSVVLPLPQIMIWLVLPKYVGRSSANYAKNLLRVTILLQYIPRMARFLPLLAGRSATGFIFESAWANFVINLLIFILAGHVVGSCWYLFGLQRVNQCLRDACSNATNVIQNCTAFIDCGHGEKIQRFNNNTDWQTWIKNGNATNCFLGGQSPVFTYGIYSTAVAVTVKSSVISKYIYSLFWGFQQISTLAGNLVPSLFVWEVLFTMGIIGLGLLLFALLIGNMQNFLQSLGRRRLEMQLRRRDVEWWMDRRRLPPHMRRRVRQSERFKWAANQGVNEEELLEDLPEDLQREIRRHLCLDLVKKVRIFTVMDDQVLDAICERLRQRLYIDGSEIFRIGYPIDKMVFIVRGNLKSVGEDGHIVELSGGDICGEELLTWCLEHSTVQKHAKKFRTGQIALSSRIVQCTGSVEAFILQAADLEQVTMLFSRRLRNPRVQGSIRYESPYWRTWAATCIQVAWRYRKKRLCRGIATED